MVIVSRKGTPKQLCVLNDKVRESFMAWYEGAMHRDKHVYFMKDLPYLCSKKRKESFNRNQLTVRCI